MTHVVGSPCDGCRYTDCVVVCPVECFYEGETMLYIHPDECIDCEACVSRNVLSKRFFTKTICPKRWQSTFRLTPSNRKLARISPNVKSRSRKRTKFGRPIRDFKASRVIAAGFFNRACHLKHFQYSFVIEYIAERAQAAC